MNKEIAACIPQKQMKTVVVANNVPVKTVRLMLTFSAPTTGTTPIDASVCFTPEFRLLGKPRKLATRKAFKGEITRFRASNTAFIEVA